MHRFGDIAIVVKDAQKSAEWFEKKLGWVVGDNDGHWVTVHIKRSPVTFHLCEGNRPERGNTGIGFLTKDVFAEAKRLKARGVRFPRPPKKMEWGTFAMFSDPDGNLYWLSQG